jgi:hypothetical protein
MPEPRAKLRIRSTSRAVHPQRLSMQMILLLTASPSFAILRTHKSSYNQ